MDPFTIPGVPVTNDTPFDQLHVWQWAREQDRRMVTLANYLKAIGFTTGKDRLTEEQYDTLHYAIETFHRCEPHMSGEYAFDALMHKASTAGFYVQGKEGRFIPSAAVVAALESAGWIHEVKPETTYFELVNETGVLWAKYQQLLGSRPIARIKGVSA